MANRTWEITVTGLDDVENLIDKLNPMLEKNFYLGFQRYVKKHLVPRIKKRLSQSSQPMQPSYTDMETGIPGGGGGYGTPKNKPKYAEWKSSRINLPQTGDLSTREMIATGYLIESIDVTDEEAIGGFFSFTVGALPGDRPSITPFKNAKGFQEVNQADLERRIENTKLMEWIADSEYAFITKEFEDVIRDVEPLVLYLIKSTLYQLAKKYGSNNG